MAVLRNKKGFTRKRDWVQECRVKIKECELDLCMITGSTWSGRSHFRNRESL